jgi:hypothetical protein
MAVVYSPDLAGAVCACIARGESLNSIGRLPGMPNRRTIHRWLAQRPEFAARCARAREAWAAARPASVRGPTDYSPELAADICERIVAGQTTRRICGAEGMPAPSALFRWLDRYPEFAAQYARAKAIQAELLADEILDIADDPTAETQDKKVRIDARKSLLAALRPKKYGDRAPLDRGPVETMSREDVERRIKELLEKARVPEGEP